MESLMLVADAFGQPIALDRQLFRHARPFPQFDDGRMHRLEEAVELTIRPQGVSQNERVEAVVLSSPPGEAIPETIALLRIDRMPKETRVPHTPTNPARANPEP